MVSKEKIADAYLEEARTREDRDRETPYKVHPITLVLLKEAGGKLVMKNELRADKDRRSTFYRSEVVYKEVIFYCETQREIQF